MGAGKEGFRECDPSAKPQGRGCIFENNEDVMAMGNLVKLWQASPFSSVLVLCVPKEYYPTFVSGMKAFIQAGAQ
jgi:hypothetical protein